jgi:hypothetical protein
MGFLGGLFGGGGGGGNVAPYKAVDAPDFTDIPTSGYGGMGYNIPANPLGMGSTIAGKGLAPPNWMTGAFAAPWWGQQAPNVGAAMLQQLDPQAYARLGQPSQQNTNPLGDLEQFKAWQKAVNKLTPKTTFSFGDNQGGMGYGFPSVSRTSVTPQNSYSDYLNALAAQQMNTSDWQLAQRSKGNMGNNLALGFDPRMVGVSALYKVQ